MYWFLSNPSANHHMRTRVLRYWLLKFPQCLNRNGTSLHSLEDTWMIFALLRLQFQEVSSTVWWGQLIRSHLKLILETMKLKTKYMGKDYPNILWSRISAIILLSDRRVGHYIVASVIKTVIKTSYQSSHCCVGYSRLWFTHWRTPMKTPFYRHKFSHCFR